VIKLVDISITEKPTLSGLETEYTASLEIIAIARVSEIEMIEHSKENIEEFVKKKLRVDIWNVLYGDLVRELSQHLTDALCKSESQECTDALVQLERKLRELLTPE